MNETNLIETQTKLRPCGINKIKNYLNSEIQERKTLSKKLSKLINAFDYIDKTLIILQAASGGISIIFLLQALLEFLQEYQVQVLLLYFLCLQE